MGEVRFAFTRDDLVAAQKAWWMGAARWQTFLKVWAGLTLAYGVMAVLLSRGTHGSARAGIIALSLAIALIVALCLFALGWLFAPYRGRKAFREHKVLAGDFIYRWAPEGIEIISERGSNRMPWTLLHGWLDGPATLMFYQSSILYNAIPKRALAPGDLDAIVDLLRSEGVHERKRFGWIGSKAGAASG